MSYVKAVVLILYELCQGSESHTMCPKLLYKQVLTLMRIPLLSLCALNCARKLGGGT